MQEDKQRTQTIIITAILVAIMTIGGFIHTKHQRNKIKEREKRIENLRKSTNMQNLQNTYILKNLNQLQK